jgi:photosystem II stability/assembly factor-like uncharacterized protein
MKISKYYITAGIGALLVVVVFLTLPGQKHDKAAAKEKFTEFKIAKRRGDTSRKPTEWFTLSRAYPYDEIPFESYMRALTRAQELRNNETIQRIGVWEMAGPSNVGGRVTAMAAHPSQPDVIYAGAALGGVLKSTDGGITWAEISDAVPSLSVGDLAIDPVDPNRLYLGTGEANASGDSYAGTGIYRTTDGGTSWEHIGLPNSHHIGKIAIDPTNPNRIFAAATGKLFGVNPDRGIYRSTDGGDSWTQVLFVSDSTAGIDVAINPTSPNIVFAAMWERVRRPQFRKVGGMTSGIWRSTDGGDNWTRLSSGLPAPGPNVGRIGLAIAPSNPSTVYASYCDNPGYFMGFYRSTNGGDTWILRSGDQGFSSFGWYFGKVWVHPTNANIVYFGDVEMWKSTDGAGSWFSIIGSMHVDHHAWYQNPSNPNFIVNGNDGGVYTSQNGGSSWTKRYDLPITQFYAMTIDKLNPHRLYGGTQDNSTPRTWDGQPGNWDVLFYGDGFYSIVDYTNSNVIYAEAQYGYLGRSTDGGNWFDIITNGLGPGEDINWCMPVVMSPHNNQILFAGCERLYKTTNRGNSWSAISPDLTGDYGGNLVYGTITTIDQSPVNAAVLWAGTDDSRVWVTTNGGTNWTNVAGTLPDRWCTRVTADVFDPATAYVTFSGYKEDELLPHIFKTTDYGANWNDISGNLGDIPINDVLPDPLYTSRLYIGTDFGMYYTNDDGATWAPLGDNHPICPVFDIDLHAGTRKIVSGTHGRSMYSYDLSQLEGGAGPEIELFPTAFADTVQRGEAVSRDLRVANVGDSPLNYGLRGDAPWISVTPDTGDVPAGLSDTVTIIFNADSLAPGTHNGQVQVNSNDTSEALVQIPVTLVVTGLCAYIPGDINDDGTANGIDITYAVAFFKGGNVPPVDCSPDCPELPGPFYAAGDVNGSCVFNGIDITFYVGYLKGQQPTLLFCPDCPPGN